MSDTVKKGASQITRIRVWLSKLALVSASVVGSLHASDSDRDALRGDGESE